MLAQKLHHEMGRTELSNARFKAIPRGGFIVLGMLAYQLDLDRAQLRPDSREGGPLVVVDDCVLTGRRLHHEMVTSQPAGEVVVVQLFSTPELRRAVERAEPGVRRCLAAEDLRDCSRDLYPEPEAHAGWQRRIRRRLGGADRYWIGLPEPISFAWTEPDSPFWNSASETFEDGWRFQPPHRCLKSRSRLAHDLPNWPADPHRRADGAAWVCPTSVIWGAFNDQVWLVRDAGEEVFSLNGSAALAWKALVVGHDEEQAAAALAAVFEVTLEQARRDVEELRAGLVRQGLLEQAETD